MEKRLFICSACGAQYRLQAWKAVCPSCKAEYTLEKALEKHAGRGLGVRDYASLLIIVYTVLSAVLGGLPNIFRLLSSLTSVPEAVFYALFLIMALTAYLGSEIALIISTVSGIAVVVLSVAAFQLSGTFGIASTALGAAWSAASVLAWIQIRRTGQRRKDNGGLIEFSGWGGD